MELARLILDILGTAIAAAALWYQRKAYLNTRKEE